MRAEITSQSAMHSSSIFNVLLRESGELGQPVRAQMISQGEQGLETLARSNKMRLVEPVAGYSGQDTHLCVGQNDGEEHVRQKIRRGFVTAERGTSLFQEHTAHPCLDPGRSEEPRVGTACVSKCRSRWSPSP